ncbi:hypothetical protein H072_1015 [Dactylellina haptotyla CBS 200.50]|uniref:Uncharacterized protein n=1 Tax=Dactylellina haptotyla (strain CBS 200.50) TaxID=1284197 RepID=S8BZS9_DACHA|nr:hypothetical protein H072_1015 [Dactylellina haptotyla CBS 200.50]
MKPQVFLIPALLFFGTSLAAPQENGMLPPGSFKKILVKQLSNSLKNTKDQQYLVQFLSNYKPEFFDDLYKKKGKELADDIDFILTSAGLKTLPNSVGRVPSTSGSHKF